VSVVVILLMFVAVIVMVNKVDEARQRHAIPLSICTKGKTEPNRQP
jgi:hypothetical protein